MKKTNHFVTESLEKVNFTSAQTNERINGFDLKLVSLQKYF